MRRMRLMLATLLLGPVALAAAERQRPLLPWQFTAAVCDLLGIPEQAPTVALPELPSRAPSTGSGIPPAYRAYLEACLDLAVDPRSERPPMHYWYGDWSTGSLRIRVAGAAQADRLAVDGASSAPDAPCSVLRPDAEPLIIRLQQVPIGIYRLSLGLAVATPDLRGPRPVRALLQGRDDRALLDRVITSGPTGATLLSSDDLMVGADGQAIWRLRALAADGVADPAAARLLIDRIRIEGPCPVDERWPPPLLRQPAGEELGDDAFLVRQIRDLVQRAWFLDNAELDQAARALIVDAEAVRRRDGLAGGLRRALGAILLDPRFLYLERAPGAEVPARLDQGEFAARLAFVVYGHCPRADERRDRIWRFLREDFTSGKGSAGELQRRAGMKLWRDEGDGEAAARSIGRLLADDCFGLDALADADLPVPEVLRDAFITEARATIAANYRQRRPVVELLDWRCVVVDQHLARHYDVPAGPPGSLRAIPVGDGHPRGGLLGLGAVLVAHRDAAARIDWLRTTAFDGAAPDLPALRSALAGFDATGVWRGDAAAAEALEASRRALRAGGGGFVLGLRRRLARLVAGAEPPPADAKAIAAMDEQIAAGKSPSLQALIDSLFHGDEPILDRRH